MSIRRLLPGESIAPFIDEYYQRLPYSRAGAAAALCELGSWEVLATAISSQDADTLVVRRNQRHEGPLPTTAEEAERLVAEGCTLLVRHAERHHAGLSELAAGFAADFAAPVNIHMYCTPSDEFGFSWHYDAEEVFIVQTTGRKEYSLRKNTVDPWPPEETLPQDMRYEREIMPLMKCELAAGDWLYIPSGYWHRGEARETALSLAIGIEPRTGVDIYDRLRQEVLRSLLWRQRLPVLGDAATLSDAELRRALAEIASQLAGDFAALAQRPALLDSLLSELRKIGSEFKETTSKR